MKRICLTLVLLAPSVLLGQEPQSEFVPVTEIPPGEQMPAVPLVLAAYAFVWLAFLAYAWTMWRKLSKVQQDLTALSSELARKRA